MFRSCHLNINSWLYHLCLYFITFPSSIVCGGHVCFSVSVWRENVKLNDALIGSCPVLSTRCTMRFFVSHNLRATSEQLWDKPSPAHRVTDTRSAASLLWVKVRLKHFFFIMYKDKDFHAEDVRVCVCVCASGLENQRRGLSCVCWTAKLRCIKDVHNPVLRPWPRSPDKLCFTSQCK